jgi:hypothetical protein
MIVNMYVDHLMSTSPTSANDVWAATQQHPKLFSDAAARVGMTPKEYKEFRAKLVSGKAVFVTLPRRVDAMSGSRHGSVYAVKNAVMTTPQKGWRVDLADGNAVYVPRVCANISFLKNGAQVAVRHVPAKKPGHHYVMSISHVPKEVPVSLEPDVPPVPEAPATVAQAIPAGGHSFPLFALFPALGGIVAAFHSTPPTTPNCNAGSNTGGVCVTK